MYLFCVVTSIHLLESVDPSKMRTATRRRPADLVAGLLSESPAEFLGVSLPPAMLISWNQGESP
jgi:hypothetical protein